jgi:hypothetical protein
VDGMSDEYYVAVFLAGDGHFRASFGTKFKLETVDGVGVVVTPATQNFSITNFHSRLGLHRIRKRFQLVANFSSIEEKETKESYSPWSFNSNEINFNKGETERGKFIYHVYPPKWERNGFSHENGQFQRQKTLIATVRDHYLIFAIFLTPLFYNLYDYEHTYDNL